MIINWTRNIRNSVFLPRNSWQAKTQPAVVMVNSCTKKVPKGEDKGVGVEAQPVGAGPGITEVIQRQRHTGQQRGHITPKVVALNEVASIHKTDSSTAAPGSTLIP